MTLDPFRCLAQLSPHLSNPCICCLNQCANRRLVEGVLEQPLFANVLFGLEALWQLNLLTEGDRTSRLRHIGVNDLPPPDIIGFDFLVARTVSCLP